MTSNINDQDQITLDISKQVEEDIKKFEQHITQTHTIRTKIISKLEQAVDQMGFDFAIEKPSSIEAKTALVNTLLKALSDSESSKVSSIKLKQKVKTDEQQEDTLKMISRTVAEYSKTLNQLTVAQFETQDRSQIETKLNELESSVEILEGELEMADSSAKDIDRTDLAKDEE